MDPKHVANANSTSSAQSFQSTLRGLLFYSYQRPVDVFAVQCFGLFVLFAHYGHSQALIFQNMRVNDLCRRLFIQTSNFPQAAFYALPPHLPETLVSEIYLVIGYEKEFAKRRELPSTHLGIGPFFSTNTLKWQCDGVKFQYSINLLLNVLLNKIQEV